MKQPFLVFFCHILVSGFCTASEPAVPTRDEAINKLEEYAAKMFMQPKDSYSILVEAADFMESGGKYSAPWTNDETIMRLLSFLHISSELLDSDLFPAYENFTYLDYAYGDKPEYSKVYSAWLDGKINSIDDSLDDSLFERLVSIWLPLARDGDPVAQYALGTLYEKHEEHALAYRWIHRSAETGLLRAQLQMYEWLNASENRSEKSIRDIPPDRQQAMYWLLRASFQDPRQSSCIQKRILLSMDLMISHNSYRAALNIYVQEPSLALDLLNNMYHRDGQALNAPIFNIPALQSLYILFSYEYNNSDDDLATSLAHRNIQCIESMLDDDSIKKAQQLAATYNPSYELSALGPPWHLAGNNPVQYWGLPPPVAILLDGVRSDPGCFSDTLRRRIDAMLASAHDSEPSQNTRGADSVSPLSASQLYQINYNERILQEIVRANRTREDMIKRSYYMDSLRLLVDQVDRTFQPSGASKSLHYEIRPKHMSVEQDSFAPGGYMNPYVLQPVE